MGGGGAADYCAQCTTACPVAHCVLELLTLESDYVSTGQKQELSMCMQATLNAVLFVSSLVRLTTVARGEMGRSPNHGVDTDRQKLSFIYKVIACVFCSGIICVYS